MAARMNRASCASRRAVAMPDSASTVSGDSAKGQHRCNCNHAERSDDQHEQPRAVRAQPGVGPRKHQGQPDQSDLPAEVHGDAQQQIQPPTGSVQDLAHLEICGSDDAIAQQASCGQENHPHRHVIGLAQQQEGPDKLEDDAEQEDAPTPERQHKAAGPLGDRDLYLTSVARHQVVDRLTGSGATVNTYGAARRLLQCRADAAAGYGQDVVACQEL